MFLNGNLKMFKLFLQKLESGFKDLSGNNSFSDESIKNSEDYLWDMYNEQKEIHKDNNLGPCYKHYVFDDDTINGYHYFHFKRFYDGNPDEFLDIYILKIFYCHFQLPNGKYSESMDEKYLFYKDCFLKRSKEFENGIKLAKVDYDKNLEIKNMSNQVEQVIAEANYRFNEYKKQYSKSKGL